MIVVLRGHIRSAFTSKRLYNFIHVLHAQYNIEIYIHTWSILQSKSSWRELEEDTTEVNEQMIRDYFGDHSKRIRWIIVDDDATVPLIGEVDGLICNTRARKLNWKKYVYGQYRIMKWLYDTIDKEPEVMVMNIRFDVFENSYSLTETQILERCNRVVEPPLVKNIMASDSVMCGIDNMILGTVHTMYVLLWHMHHHLDEICWKYPELKHPEYLFFYENESLCYEVL